MADRLSLAHAIERAGIDRDTAEQIAVEIDELVHENVATKHDLALLRIELKGDIAAIEHRLITRLGGLVVVVAGLLFAALHHWPPHP